MSMSGIAEASKSAGVACAMLVSEVLVAVAVVVACTCKFVKVSINRRVHVTAGVFIPSLSPIIIITDDSRPFSGLGIVAICGYIRACSRLRLFPCS